MFTQILDPYIYIRNTSYEIPASLENKKKTEGKKNQLSSFTCKHCPLCLQSKTASFSIVSYKVSYSTFRGISEFTKKIKHFYFIMNITFYNESSPSNLHLFLESKTVSPIDHPILHPCFSPTKTQASAAARCRPTKRELQLHQKCARESISAASEAEAGPVATAEHVVTLYI